MFFTKNDLAIATVNNCNVMVKNGRLDFSQQFFKFSVLLGIIVQAGNISRETYSQKSPSPHFPPAPAIASVVSNGMYLHSGTTMTL